MTTRLLLLKTCLHLLIWSKFLEHRELITLLYCYHPITTHSHWTLYHSTGLLLADNCKLFHVRNPNLKFHDFHFHRNWNMIFCSKWCLLWWLLIAHLLKWFWICNDFTALEDEITFNVNYSWNYIIMNLLSEHWTYHLTG